MDNIYIKYEKYIKQAEGGYLDGITYAEIMEILRYIEGRLGKSIPTNVSCSTCIVGLIKMFSRLQQ